MNTFYIWINNSKKGPFTPPQLRELLRSGKAAPDSPVIDVRLFNAKKPWENQWASLDAVLSTEPEQYSDESEYPPEAIRFTCGICSSSLSVKLARSAYSHRCPQCKTIYKVTLQQTRPYVYLIMPVIEKEAAQEECREVPRDVAESLAFFGLKADVRPDEVKKSYKHKISQYHPDKVAHMAPEFREIAEEKSKEINRHYSVISKWMRL